MAVTGIPRTGHTCVTSSQRIILFGSVTAKHFLRHLAPGERHGFVRTQTPSHEHAGQPRKGWRSTRKTDMLAVSSCFVAQHTVKRPASAMDSNPMSGGQAKSVFGRRDR